MLLLFFAIMYAPEDSNCQYLLDKQLAHYFPSWEVHFDSTINGLHTCQGCLDLLNWYIDLETRFEVYLSKILGLRYRNHFRGDYADHISNHYFEPFFQLKENLRLLFSITTHYYKGENELGIGLFLGKNYLNYLETFLIAEDFDRNFSLQATPGGPGKIIYKRFRYPLKFKATFNKIWQTGRLHIAFDLSTNYLLESTDEPASYQEEGLHRFFNSRIWQDINKLRLGCIFDLKQSIFSQFNSGRAVDENINEIIFEPMISCRISDMWIPHLYLTYNDKTDDYASSFQMIPDSIYYYRRDVYAYLIDVEFYPGGNFVWHFGTQRQFYYNNQGRTFKERRINLGLEYRFKNIWFYLVEAMEGDFPTPKYLHNHTYLQLMVRF